MSSGAIRFASAKSRSRKITKQGTDWFAPTPETNFAPRSSHASIQSLHISKQAVFPPFLFFIPCAHMCFYGTSKITTARFNTSSRTNFGGTLIIVCDEASGPRGKEMRAATQRRNGNVRGNSARSLQCPTIHPSLTFLRSLCALTIATWPGMKFSFHKQPP